MDVEVEDGECEEREEYNARVDDGACEVEGGFEFSEEGDVGSEDAWEDFFGDLGGAFGPAVLL